MMVTNKRKQKKGCRIHHSVGGNRRPLPHIMRLSKKKIHGGRRGRLQLRMMLAREKMERIMKILGGGGIVVPLLMRLRKKKVHGGRGDRLPLLMIVGVKGTIKILG
jgi:hypothetical protein